MPSKKPSDIVPSNGIIRSLSSQRMARLLEKAGYIVQVLHSDDGKPAVRFMNLGVDGMAMFFTPEGDDLWGMVVLNTHLQGALPPDQLNTLNSKGILPKIYVTETDTVVELCIPVEAGLTDDAVLYYVRSYASLLKNL